MWLIGVLIASSPEDVKWVQKKLLSCLAGFLHNFAGRDSENGDAFLKVASGEALNMFWIIPTVFLKLQHNCLQNKPPPLFSALSPGTIFLIKCTSPALTLTCFPATHPSDIPILLHFIPLPILGLFLLSLRCGSVCSLRCEHVLVSLSVQHFLSWNCLFSTSVYADYMKLHPYPPPLGLASVICSKMGIEPRSGQPEVSLSLLLKLLGKKDMIFSSESHKLQRYEPGAINSHLCHNIRKACLRMKPAQMKDENRFLRLLVRFRSSHTWSPEAISFNKMNKFPYSVWAGCCCY